MGSGTTIRSGMGWRSVVCFAIAAAFGLVFHAHAAHEHCPHSAEILAPAGQPAAIHLNRVGLRVEPTRGRTTFPTACILAGAGSMAGTDGRGQILVERRRARRFDPVQVRTGRSPPPSFS